MSLYDLVLRPGKDHVSVRPYAKTWKGSCLCTTLYKDLESVLSLYDIVPRHGKDRVSVRPYAKTWKGSQF